MSTLRTEAAPPVSSDAEGAIAPPHVPPDDHGKFDPMNAIFIGGTHVLGLVGLVYLIMGRAHWATVVLAIVWNAACSLSITGGYHRLFSHRAYECVWPLKLFYLIFGAASVQNSALTWSSLHRWHHSHTDEELDPYNAHKGFWWSHVGWVFFKGLGDRSNIPDLRADKLVQWQHRWYLALVGIFTFAIPIALCAAWGDAWGGVLVAVFLRLTIQYNSTFAINSFAHMLGGQPYSVMNSARDSWVTALLTLGEGYHNYHHRFPSDYRNGIRWRDFDPTKWWVFGLSRLGLTRGLRRIPDPHVDAAREHAVLAGTPPPQEA